MNFPDLVLRLTEFFFNDVVHFILLIVLIFVLQGGISKITNSVSRFYGRVKTKYLDKIKKDELIAKRSAPDKVPYTER
jgi:hypothetical protein